MIDRDVLIATRLVLGYVLSTLDEIVPDKRNAYAKADMIALQRVIEILDGFVEGQDERTTTH